MNWRCIKHPLAGGAEVYTHEIAKKLAATGHEVILATSNPGNLPSKEIIDGYTVIRRGGKYTVYLGAKKTYHELRREGWRPDIVIDEVNTIPFLTPLYVEEPIAVLIHQLCKECWAYAYHPVVQPLGWWLERNLHRIYVGAARRGRLKAVITVSPSTKQDLLELGYPENLVHIVYNGLDWGLYRDCAELAWDKQDLVVYIGRVTPYKRIEDILNAWRRVEERHPGAQLVIAGRAEPRYLKRLRSLAEELGLKRAAFKTGIPQEEKKHLLAKAKVLVYTSVREGWGQTIMEAAACKTPAVAYNVPGLRDSVKHMETGILVEPGDAEQLAETITQLLTDNTLRNRLAENAYKYTQQLSWNIATKDFSRIIEVLSNG